MSLATSAAAGSPSAAASAEQLIAHRIQEARSALWWAELLRGVLRMLIVWLVAVLLWVVIDQWVYSAGVGGRLAAAVALVVWSLWWLIRHIVPLLGCSIQKEYAARSLERDMPEMRQELTSYVTLQDDHGSTGLRSRVLRSIGAQAAGKLRAHDALPAEATGTLKWWMTAALTLALLAGYAVMSPKNTFRSAGRLLAPLASIEPARRVSIEDVQPGDADAIAGRHVEVSASILGLNEHDPIWCRWETDAGGREAELALDEDSGRYRGQIQLEHLAAGDVAYQIEAGDATAGPFHLRVQDVPVVAVESIRYQPPSYTGQVPHTSSSASISGIDGTQVSILASTNREVVKANIEFNPRPLGDSIQATAGAAEMQIADGGTSLSISFPLRSARGRSAAVQLESYRVKVWDAAGQSNPDPIIYPIRVIADLPPEVSIVMPRKSPKDVPIDAQQVIEVHAMDADFGLRRVGLEVRRGIDMIAEPTLWTDPQGAKGNRVSDYRFRPAEHGLRVGDVVQITATATDNRVVESDSSIEPNVSVTDPIKLRITASERVPNEPGGGDGLSPPDERPASDAEAGEEGEQESGEGSSGGEGASGEGATGENGSSGAGSSGEGKTGESGEGGSSGEGGKGGSGSSEGGNTEDSSGSGDSPGGQPGERNQPGSSDDPPAGDASSEPSDGENSATGSDSTKPGSAGEKPAGGQQPSASGEAGANDAMSEQGTPNGDGAPDPNGQTQPDESAGGGSTADDSGKSSTGEAKSGETKPEGSGNQPSAQGGSESAGEQPGDPSESQQAPEHDGKAFERIRDYLEDMKRKGGSSGEDSPDAGSKQSGEPSSDGAGTRKPEQSPDGGGSRGSSDDAAGSTEGSADQRGSEGDSKGETGEGSDTDATGKGAGDSRAVESESESGTGESKPGESESGESKSGQSEPGESESGESKSGQSESGESESGESKPGESKPGESKSGESKSGESKSGESESGESESGEPGESKPGESGSDAAESTGDQTRPGDSSATADSSNQPSKDGSQQSQTRDPSQSPSQGGSGSGAGTDTGGKESEVATPPDPVDLEYAKQATDMVLDYLEQTRDAPDSDLLDRLNWTEDDLKRFAERWKKVRELDQASQPEQGSRDVQEALRSLGLRPPTQATANNRGTSDSLRGVRDAGNRKPPPPAYQDAFDAFRRAVGRKR